MNAYLIVGVVRRWPTLFLRYHALDARSHFPDANGALLRLVAFDARWKVWHLDHASAAAVSNLEGYCLRSPSRGQPVRVASRSFLLT